MVMDQKWRIVEEPNCEQGRRSALLRGDEPSTVQGRFLSFTLEHNVPPWLPSFVPSHQSSRIRHGISFDRDMLEFIMPSSEST